MRSALKKNQKSDDVSLYDSLINEYHFLEKSTRINTISAAVSYTSPVNFRESMTTPRHRWFPYKEGFSPSFVKDFLQKNYKNKSGIVFDPFSGVGTTSIVSGELGYQAVGYDVSPLAVFVAKTKSLVLSSTQKRKLNNYIEDFSKSSLRKEHSLPENETVISYFDEPYLAALLRAKHYIAEIQDIAVQSLFQLAFLSIIETFSTHRKAGNGVKEKTRLGYETLSGFPINHVKSAICELLRVYVADINLPSQFKQPEFSIASCLDEEAYDKLPKIGCLITSPPYANCFDYSKIYMRELWLGDFFKNTNDQKLFRKASVRSHVHATWSERYKHFENDIVEGPIKELLKLEKLWSNKIPDMLSGYFKDMGRLLYLLNPKLLKGARAGFVVSNSFYGGVPIATDLLISQSAEKLGYKTVSIDIYRNMIPSSQQYNRIEDKYFMRESLVVLEKVR